jgi:DNA transformation protein and related proteins
VRTEHNAGAAAVTVSTDYLAYVLDQLHELGGVSSRRMFGGAGLYCDEFFFGLIADDTLYLRVDDSNRSDYTARGMAQFRPYPDRPVLSMSYYEAPAEVLEDRRLLATWAARSVAVARSAAVRPARRKRAEVPTRLRKCGARVPRR